MILQLIARARGRYLACQHIFDTQHLPVTGKDFLGTGGIAEHVLAGEGGEHAAVTQVVGGDLRHVLGQWRRPLPTEGHHGNRCSPVAASGNLDGFLSQCDLCHQQHGSAGQPVLQCIHQKSKSSGLKRKVRCLYIRSNAAGLSRDNCCISGIRPTLRTAWTADWSNPASPLERSTTTSVISPEGSMLIRTSTTMPLRAVGGLRHCSLT